MKFVVTQGGGAGMLCSMPNHATRRSEGHEVLAAAIAASAAALTATASSSIETLVSMTTNDWGQSTAEFAYDEAAWTDWYNNVYVPYKREQAIIDELAR